MKKMIIAAALVLVASVFGASNASAMSFETAALQAAVDAGCITPDQKNNCIVNVEITSACFVSGYITTAHVYYNPAANCPGNPNKPCPKPAVTLKTDVVFGCNNEIQSVTCF